MKQLPNNAIFLIGQVTINNLQNLNILFKGLNFIPTNTDHDKIQTEITNMGPKIDSLIRTMIIDQKPPDYPNPPPKNKHLQRYNFTTKFLEHIADKYNDITKTTIQQHNLTHNERKALKNLKLNKDIIIKPADKNLGICIIEKQLYFNLAQTQHLTDLTTYKPLPDNPIQKTVQHINETLKKLHETNNINKRTLNTLLAKPNDTPGLFYILPKLHKRTLETRPIVSNVNHPTRKISKYIHNTLLQTTTNAKSYLKNSFELTNTLKDIKITKTTFIITADIKSLYTNIPNSHGIQTVAQEMSTTKTNLTTLKTLLTLVLENNIFTFNNGHYLQINGTAMGTIMAPTYANTYLKHLEEKTFLNKDKNKHLDNVLLFKRYIDDILIIYDNHNNSLPDALKLLHQTYQPLQLTTTIGQQNITYLDTDITIDTIHNQITTQLHVKPTSNKSYIPPTSQHTQHTLKNIIYNDLLRTNRLCTDESDRNRHEQTILRKAITAGYNKKDLQRLKTTARKKTKRLSPSQETASSKTYKIMLSLTHMGTYTEELTRSIKKFWHENANKNTHLLISSKTQKSLRKILVRSKN